MDWKRHSIFVTFGFLYLGGFQYYLYNVKFTQVRFGEKGSGRKVPGQCRGWGQDPGPMPIRGEEPVPMPSVGTGSRLLRKLGTGSGTNAKCGGHDLGLDQLLTARIAGRQAAGCCRCVRL